MTATSTRQGGADGPPPLPHRGTGGVGAISADRSPCHDRWRFRDELRFHLGSVIQPRPSQTGGRRAASFSVFLVSHRKAKTKSWHDRFVWWPNTCKDSAFDDREVRVIFSDSRKKPSHHTNHAILVPGVNLSSNFLVDTDVVVHATLGIRPTAAKNMTGTDSQGRMDQRTEATLAVKG